MTVQPSPSKPLCLSSPIPQPKFKIGDSVEWGGRDRSYYEWRYLRYLVRHWRLTNKKLSDGGKAIIRKVMRVIREATTAEIAGIIGRGMHSFDTADYNQCYIGGVPGASSPMYFEYQLLFRWQEGNNILAMVTGIAITSDCDLKFRQPTPA